MKIPIKGLGDIGWVADQAAYELAPNAVSDLNNMRCRAGWIERIRGHRQIGDNLSYVPYQLFPYITSETKYIVEAGLRNITVFDGNTRTDISYASGLTMDYGDKWTGGFLGGFQILNNQVDTPLSWTGSLGDDCIALANWTSTHRAKAMRVLRYHIVGLNITKGSTNYPHRVKISGAAEPGSLPASFDETDPTEETDEFDVPGDGALVDGAILGEAMILYKEFSCAALRYAPNATSAWVVEPLPFKIGAMTQNCVINVPGIGHVILTKGDVCRFDGNTVESIVDGTHRDWLFSNIDENYYNACFVTINEKYSEVWVCFPERGYNVCTKALTWNYRTGKVGKRDLPNVTCATPAVISYAIDTIDSDSVTFDSESVLTMDSGNESLAVNDTRLFMGTTGAELFVMDSGDTADGSNFTAYFERTGLNEIGGLDDQVKFVNRVWLNVDAAAGTQLSVYVGGENDAETAPTYSSAVTYTVGTDQYVNAWATGRFLALKVSGTGDDYWRARGFTLEVANAGQF